MRQGFIVCCSKFDSTSLKNIPTAKRSARLLNEILKHEEFGEFSDVECLIDPTQSHVTKSFKQCTADLSTRSILYIHVISHVFKVGKEILIGTKDTKKSSKESNSTKAPVKGLTPKRLAKLICDQRAIEVAITLDTCMSAEFQDRLLDEIDAIEITSGTNAHKKKRIHVLTVSDTSDNHSYTDYQGSALTNQIFRLLLTGEPASRSPQIALERLESYTRKYGGEPDRVYRRS